MLPGIPEVKCIMDGIHNCRAMVVIVSTRSDASIHVMREVKKATENGKPVIPFRIEDFRMNPDMEYYLGSVHWLDALTPPMEQHLDRLTVTLQRLLGIQETPPARPAAAETRAPVYTPAPAPVRKSPGRKVPGAVMVVAAVVIILAISVFAVFILGNGGGSGGGGGGATITPTPGPSGGNGGGGTSVAPVVISALQPITPVTDNGDQETFRGGVARTGVYESLTAPRLDTLKWTFKAGNTVCGTPAVVGDTVYEGSYDGNIYALDRSTGYEKWHYSTGGWICTSPTVKDGVVYCGSDDGYLYTLDATTGKLKWKYDLKGWVQSVPAVWGNNVYVVSNDSIIYAFDRNTGKVAGTFDLCRYYGQSYQWSSPAIANNMLYVAGSDNPYVYAIDLLTGDLAWYFNTGGSDAIGATPAVYDGVVYIGNYGGYMYALDATTGAKIWSEKIGETIFSSAAVTDGAVYVGTYSRANRSGSMVALERKSGRTLWVYPTSLEVMSSPCVAGGTVYFGCYDNYLYALDAKTGTWKGDYQTGYQVWSSPAVYDGVVYFGSSDAFLYAIG